MRWSAIKHNLRKEIPGKSLHAYKTQYYRIRKQKGEGGIIYKWSDEDDKLLQQKASIQEKDTIQGCIGPEQWKEISTHFFGRSWTTCQQRYQKLRKRRPDQKYRGGFAYTPYLCT